MISRTIVRRLALHILHDSSASNMRTTINSKHLFLPHRAPNHVPNAIQQLRLYTTPEVNLENMIVDFEQVKKATTQKDVLIVDVREPDEIKEHGKIPNSINIPLGAVSSALGTGMSEKEFEQTYNRPKPTEDSEIIFYCMIGKRSGMAQQNAFNLGYKNVKNYLGSWTDWASKGQ